MRRRGVGLVGTAVVAGAVGSNAAKRSAQEQAQDQQIAALEQQQAMAQQAQTAPPPPQYAAPPAPVSAGPQVATDATLEQIRKLGELKKEGLLTNDEFETQKKRLLG
jgi:hypothetical protein